MEVMTLHKWEDCDVEKIIQAGHNDYREIVLKESNEGALIISKKDVIALAHEFSLIVYEKDSNLIPIDTK